MVTKARKKFVVVAYDISSARRRDKVVKILQQYGRRINFSVFECMFSDGQLSAVREEIGSIINSPRTRWCTISFALAVMPGRFTSRNGVCKLVTASR